MYLAELDAFRYRITAVGKTKKEAVNAVMREYSAEYKARKGVSPGRVVYEVPRRSYYAVMKDEVVVTELKNKKAIWRSVS